MLLYSSGSVHLLFPQPGYLFPSYQHSLLLFFKSPLKITLSKRPPLRTLNKAALALPIHLGSPEPAWFPFTQHIKESYVVSDIISDMRKIEAQFCTDMGIPNSNTDKRERLITSEVNSNNVETATRCELWLEEIRKGLTKANDMFNLSLEVDWRVNPDLTWREI